MIPIENVDFYLQLTAIFSFAVGIVSKHYADAYLTGKKKISGIRKLIDDVDEALKDDTVSEAEFAQIFADVKGLIQK
jgi:hypothetical protein